MYYGLVTTLTSLVSKPLKPLRAFYSRVNYLVSQVPSHLLILAIVVEFCKMVHDLYILFILNQFRSSTVLSLVYIRSVGQYEMGLFILCASTTYIGLVVNSKSDWPIIQE